MKKFLIVRLSSLGDIVHTLPIVYEIKKTYPNARIDWLTSNKGFNFLKLVSQINQIYSLSLKNLFLIQRENYDFVIDVQGLFKSALLARISFSKDIVGFRNAREFASILYKTRINVGNLFRTNKHVVELNLELIKSVLNENGKNKNGDIRFLIPKIVKPTTLPNDVLNKINKNNSIILFPSTTWSSKLWPMDYWYEFIKLISQEFNLFICGSNFDLPNCLPLLNKLNSANIKYENLISYTTFKDLIFLIQNVSLVIGMDSFGLHLASAIKNDFGMPNVLGIYGPTSPKRNGPFDSTGDCLYLSELDCIACRKKKCPLGHHKCMNDILPKHLYDKVCAKYMINF